MICPKLGNFGFSDGTASFSMGNPPAVGLSVTYVTECKKYRYGGIIARKAGQRVRLYSRPGNDVTWR
jgi:hypothetical protein